MKPTFSPKHSLALILACTVFAGCLPKQPTVSARHFILSPTAAAEGQRTTISNLAIGIDPVKMPGYLLRDAIVIRRGTNEINYLENALWGERLDHSFSRIIGENLSRLLPSESVYFADWNRSQVKLKLFITVQQFDVDTEGEGMLIAEWRILGSDSDKLLKSGRSRLSKTGTSPHGDARAIAATMSILAAEFSRELSSAFMNL